MKRHETPKNITREMLENAFNDPSLMDKLLSDTKASDEAWKMLKVDDHRACAFLCRAAKKKTVREHILSLYAKDGREIFRHCIDNENPKLRKNISKLMGTLAVSDCDELLIKLLEKENVRMIIPSVILALGNIGTDKAFTALSEYHVKPANDDTEIKHEHEEREALKKALSLYEKNIKHEFIGLEDLPAVQLICAKSMGKYVAEDCKRAGIDVLNFSDSGVNIHVNKTENLLKVRSYREILIPVCKKGSQMSGLRENVLQILNKTHIKSDSPFRFRIEYRGSGDRKSQINRAVENIECDELINSVSDYEVEIRIYDDSSVKMKLFTYEDKRFLYRKAAISASISPANAASVMSYARKYFSENAVVMDMCCGSGTMLFERDAALKCRRIIGVDITEKAIIAAKENAKSKNPKALFYHADCTRFKLNVPVDEIISNLPFGNRVGTHSENEKLYEKIFVKMGEWLKDGGIAVLYTMEAKLLLEQVKKSDAFQLLDMIKTEAGGLMPAVVVLRKCI